MTRKEFGLVLGKATRNIPVYEKMFSLTGGIEHLLDAEYAEEHDAPRDSDVALVKEFEAALNECLKKHKRFEELGYTKFAKCFEDYGKVATVKDGKG